MIQGMASTVSAGWAGWAGLGLAGAALPLCRRRSWAESTRNSHLMMCLVMVAMVLPSAPWWFPVGGLVLLFVTSAGTLTGRDTSPNAMPCLIDAVAMGLMVLVGVVMGHGTEMGPGAVMGPGDSGMGGHSSAGFTLLTVQIAAAWMFATYWSRRSRTVRPARSGRTTTGHRLAAVAFPVAGTTLMAVAMSAMMIA